jgi:hypothetical protein
MIFLEQCLENKPSLAFFRFCLMYLLQQIIISRKGFEPISLTRILWALIVGLGYVWIVSYLESDLKCHKNVCDCVAAVVSFTLSAFPSQNILTFLLSCCYREARLGLKTLEIFCTSSTKRSASH